MPSIYLSPVSQEQFLQSGGIGSSPSLQLRAGNVSPADVSLYPVIAGTLSTIINYNNTDIRLYPVVDDTPPIVKTYLSCSIFLQTLSTPSIVSSGSDLIPATLRLRTGEVSPVDIRLQSVDRGSPSTKTGVMSVDVLLYPIQSPGTAKTVIALTSEGISAIDFLSSIDIRNASIIEALSVIDSPISKKQTNSSISSMILNLFWSFQIADILGRLYRSIMGR